MVCFLVLTLIMSYCTHPTGTHPFLTAFTSKVNFGLPYHKTLLSCFPSPVVTTLDCSPSYTQPCDGVFKVSTSSCFLCSSFSTCKTPFCPFCSSYCCNAINNSLLMSIVATCSWSFSHSRIHVFNTFLSVSFSTQ